MYKIFSVLVCFRMLLLGKTQKKHPGDCPVPMVLDLPLSPLLYDVFLAKNTHYCEHSMIIARSARNLF